MGTRPHQIDSEVARSVIGYLSSAIEGRTDPAASERAKLHVLDCLVAVLSGSLLPAGVAARRYVGRRPTAGPSTVVGLANTTIPEFAALANGIAAHADETDDTGGRTRMHPGATVIPTALALAESRGRGGTEVLAAVVAGYHFGMAMNLSLWGEDRNRQHAAQNPCSVGQVFGGTAAGIVLARLEPRQQLYALSYASQQASGSSSLYRDSDHMEKAFVMGGMPARDAVTAVEFVSEGFTGVLDALEGHPGIFDAIGDGEGGPERLVALLASAPLLLSNAEIKLFPVGMPIQAAAQALQELHREEGLRADDLDRLRCRIPATKAHLVDSREMPAIDLRYILTVILQDGDVTFAAAHDERRHRSADVRAVMSRIDVVHDEGLDPQAESESNRRAVLEVQLRDGRTLTRRVDALAGTPVAPVSWERLIQKASTVLDGILEDAQLERMIDAVRALEDIDDIRDVTRHLRGT